MPNFASRAGHFLLHPFDSAAHPHSDPSETRPDKTSGPAKPDCPGDDFDLGRMSLTQTDEQPDSPRGDLTLDHPCHEGAGEDIDAELARRCL